MLDGTASTVDAAREQANAQSEETSKSLLSKLIWVYVWGSAAAIVVTFFLVFVGLEFTFDQWMILFMFTPIVVPTYVLIDIYLIIRQYRPLKKVMVRLDGGDIPTPEEASPAIVRALNLPFYAFIRVTFIHGPITTTGILLGMLFMNIFMDAQYAVWQIAGFVLTALFFSSPTHAIFEYFAISRILAPTYLRLWSHCPLLQDEDRKNLVSINLKQKLLYLAVFLTALPLFFFAISIFFKVELLLEQLGVDASFQQLTPLLMWIAGVVGVCMLGALAMSVLTASEVSSSAARMIRAMHDVEEGKLDHRLFITTTDEYEDLYRGFNGMTASLREEVQILEISQELSGELNLDRLIARIMTATTDLLSAERSTLFVHDHKTNELWSRFAEGIEVNEIRFPDDQGIAGAVFQSGEPLNIDDPYSHDLFNPAVDKATGFVTRSILCMPIVNKNGEGIGVTQVLNKEGGNFTGKDEARLRAFTAQVGVSLENAQLFDDVLNIKNYNEGILHSTTNGMITLDTERCIVTANDSAREILKSTETELIGTSAAALFTGNNEWLLHSIENVERTHENDISVDAELELADGEKASVNVTVSPLLDIADENIGSMVILEDISNEKRVRTTMARYMSKEVADQLLAEGESALGGTDQHVSILFSDVRSFTSISEALGARETVSMLNEYFEEMVDVILQNGGILDKYIGDAIMALFGAPFAGEHDADNAVTVANGMMVALRHLNERRVADDKAPIDIGIGVGTGEVIVGNIGSTKRMEYTVIGDSVNLAARLEGATKFYGTKILVSEFTVKELKTNSSRLRDIDLMQVKGKDIPVTVFEALGYHTPESFPNMEESLQAFEEGLRRYRAADWTQAIKLFGTANAANSNDRVSEIYLERANHYHANPPGDDWNGVWVLTEK